MAIDQNLYEKYPLTLLLTLSFNSKPIAKLYFSHLIKLDLVIANPELMEPYDNIPSAFICSQLFPSSMENIYASPNPAHLFLDDGYIKTHKVNSNSILLKQMGSATHGYRHFVDTTTLHT